MVVGTAAVENPRRDIQSWDSVSLSDGEEHPLMAEEEKPGIIERILGWWRASSWPIRVGAVVAVVVLTVGVLVYDAMKEPPIREQNCSELADTFQDIRKKIAPSSSFEDQQEGARDADDLNDRVDALGGCPGEPSLQ